MPDFEARLAHEIVESERLRMALLAGLFAGLAAVFPLLAWIFREEYLRLLHSYATLEFVTALCIALVAYELFLRAVYGWWLRRRGVPPRALRFWNALVETSMPSALIVFASTQTDTATIFQGPAPFLYALFIVLSTLRLDFALALFTGAVAAAEFAALALYYGEGHGAMAIKALVLLVTGIAAGFVAWQLRLRMHRVLRSAEERERVLSAFGQQVSPAVAAELLRRGAGMPSRRSFVCVMFMDIRNFTPLVESRSPEEIVALQNAVFGVAIDVVNRHHGIINQFLGDGFMATFGAPLATGDDCRNALAAARELVSRITEVRVGIGLHAGDAVTGNVGSEARKQYSVTGNVVILASRIEQLNKQYESQLLVSKEVLDRCQGEAQAATSLGPVHVKGRQDPIEIYRMA